jgi:amidase
MARSAQDLRLELEVIAGPAPEEAQAYRWVIPAARGGRLKDYRLGYVSGDPFCPVSPEVNESLVQAIEALRRAGADLTEGWPEGYDPGKAFDRYLMLLAAAFSEAFTAEERELMRDNVESCWGDYARRWLKGSGMPHAEWRAHSGQRLRSRAIWQQYFQTYDAFLMPVNLIPAFTHDHELSFFERTLTTPTGPRQYGEMLRWISPATLAGCPATVAPVGQTANGLPVGIQIMGPFLEDATPIDLAARFGEVLGGFGPPPGFA